MTSLIPRQTFDLLMGNTVKGSLLNYVAVQIIEERLNSFGRETMLSIYLVVLSAKLKQCIVKKYTHIMHSI